MWHLIVPPIVVVACFVFVIWYLSLRGADPGVIRRVEVAGARHGGILRSWLRGISLRVIEKMAQRFKLLSLKVYNGFHVLSQSVKAKRKLSEEHAHSAPVFFSKDDRSSLSPEDALGHSLASEGARYPHARDSEPSVSDGVLPEKHGESALESDTEGFSMTSPLRRRRTREEVFPQEVAERVTGRMTPAPRPMVSEEASRPEVLSEKPKRKGADIPIEEELIARIATNPKDYTAYESLGDFYMDRGSIQDAKECYKQVLKLSPVQRLVKMKIRRLERLMTQK